MHGGLRQKFFASFGIGLSNAIIFSIFQLPITETLWWRIIVRVQACWILSVSIAGHNTNQGRDLFHEPHANDEMARKWELLYWERKKSARMRGPNCWGPACWGFRGNLLTT